ncbi:MAG: bifunctional diaminohydroxyphosphoribosylaminopyrimidine deaminase/5-amino-6-(5-phosphoribosylamino)uracil reductase RibD [Dehalococcoidia bacterium]|nr:MAG: bifunctional diaminohydroxyphosphoribosylaminopyrimidine deaminase/5-amino-6-(5-phosphoribosylamino)uracil reductase RibD [Dehalococcoidia bacterium]
MNDEYYMRKALNLARRGLGKTRPNPMVGALIVRDGEIIGQGYHRRYGGDHAEIIATRDAKGDMSGATLYVTLEPCCHQGKKTPPCLDALLKYNLERVVIGTVDPNPQVNGKSIEVLRERGVETKVGVLSEECYRLNEVYFKYIQTGIPFVTLKFAQTLDGRIASTTGDSRWISSEPSLKLAHRLRSFHDAVLVGVGTVLRDDPQLTVRQVKGRNPIRIVTDSRLRIPLNSKILGDQEIAPTIIATTSQADRGKSSALMQMGIEILMVGEDKEGEVDLEDLLKKLGQRDFSSILVEGGATLITSLIRQELADRFIVILAPKIMGKGIDAVGDLGISDVERALKLSLVKTYRSGEDLVIEARPEVDRG